MLAVAAAVAVGIVVVSGGSGADPRTPAGVAGEPAPFLGTAVAGSGGLTAAVDAYGDVVDLRASPAGPALIDNPAARQAAGTVPADTGIVPRVSVEGGPALALWQADSVTQAYLPGTNVVRTVARFGDARVAVVVAVHGDQLAVQASGPTAAKTALSVDADRSGWRLCQQRCGGVIRAAARADRRWLSRARPLGAGAPGWARRMYARSLLTLRALTDGKTGAVAAGARDGWAYVWPRDAATAALAFDAAGYRDAARRVSRLLSGLDLEAAARFTGSGAPVPGRGEQGDANGWVQLAAVAAGTDESAVATPPTDGWRGRADYQEGEGGEYLGNAIVAGASLRPFETGRGLVRRARDPASGLDSAAAWAVRPFPTPSALPAARRTLLRLLAAGTPYGITPGAGWHGGVDPWTAPTAWTAWSLAALGERGAALRLLGDLRRAATAAGSLPERVDARTGVPRSTTPLAWSHAFAVLALRQLWPSG